MTNPRGLGLHDSTLYVCDAGLKVMDASDVDNMTVKEHHNISAFDVIPNVGGSNLLFVIGDEGLYQYQLINSQLELLSVIPLGS